MLSTVTGQAPSLSLQTSQEINRETRLLGALGFQRSALGPRISPTPAGFCGEGPGGTGRGGRQSSPDGQGVGRGQRPGRCRSSAAEQDAWLPIVERSPPWATSRESQRARRAGRAQVPAPLQSPPPPTPNPLAGVGGDQQAPAPQSLTFSNKLPSVSSQGRGRPRRPGRNSTPRTLGARRRLTSRRGAGHSGSRNLWTSRWGSKAPGWPRTARATAAPGAGDAHSPQGVPAEKPASV